MAAGTPMQPTVQPTSRSTDGAPRSQARRQDQTASHPDLAMGMIDRHGCESTRGQGCLHHRRQKRVRSSGSVTLREEGAARIYLADDRLDRIAAELEPLDVTVGKIRVDLSEIAACEQAVREAHENAGRIDVPISKAAVASLAQTTAI